MGEISDLQGKYCVVARSWQSTICRFSEIETEQRKIRSDKHAPFSGSSTWVAAGLCVLLPGLMFAMITDHHCEILYHWDQIWTSTGSIHGIGWVVLLLFFSDFCA